MHSWKHWGSRLVLVHPIPSYSLVFPLPTLQEGGVNSLVDEKIEQLVISLVKNQKLLSKNQSDLVKKYNDLKKLHDEMSEALDVLATDYLNKNIDKGDVMVA